MKSNELLDQLALRKAELVLPLLTNKATFEANLCFIYHTIWATESLLALAIELATDADNKLYLQNHAKEEKNHAEWLLADLTSVGLSPGLPCKESVALAGSQYYYLMRFGYPAIFGYMAVLESGFVSQEQLEALESVYGKSLLRTVRYHCDNDPSHLKDLCGVIDNLSDNDFAIVEFVAYQTSNFMQDAFVKILKETT